MSVLQSARPPIVLRALFVSLAATLLLTVAMVDVASAHGSVVDPASRNYGCLERWGDNHLAPEMQTEDPMCWGAWQANPNAMWNWNGLYRENVGGNHQAAIPDGTLCSGGNTEGGRYDFLDTPGNWITTPVGTNFQVRLLDGASHGADYIRVYVTRQGYNPVTQPLRWSDLELVGQIGNTPASQWEQVDGGVAINTPASAPGRSGHHVVYTIWQASHLDQPYYLCSDVNFGGSPTTPPTTTPPTTTPPTTTPPTTTPPTTQPPTTQPPTGGGCSASYTLASSWGGGFQGEVTVTAGSSAISGWTVTMAFPGGEQITQIWNATATPSGSSVTATNLSYNGSLGAGASTNFGFLGSGNAGTPTLSCSAS